MHNNWADTHLYILRLLHQNVSGITQFHCDSTAFLLQFVLLLEMHIVNTLWQNYLFKKLTSN